MGDSLAGESLVEGRQAGTFVAEVGSLAEGIGHRGAEEGAERHGTLFM